MRPNYYVLEYFHHKLATLVAPSDDIEKNRNIGAQLQSILYTTAQ